MSAFCFALSYHGATLEVDGLGERVLQTVSPPFLCQNGLNTLPSVCQSPEGRHLKWGLGAFRGKRSESHPEEPPGGYLALEFCIALFRNRMLRCWSVCHDIVAQPFSSNLG